MAAGLYQCTALQSRARPADRSGSHYRNGFGVVSLSQNLAEETQRVIHGGAPFHSASASPTGYAPAERNSVLSTLTSLEVGQTNLPKAYVSHDPFEGLVLPKIARQARFFFTLDEIQRIIAAASGPLK